MSVKGEADYGKASIPSGFTGSDLARIRPGLKLRPSEWRWPPGGTLQQIIKEMSQALQWTPIISLSL